MWLPSTMLRLHLAVYFYLCTVVAFENWPLLSENQDDASRAQRDMSENIPIDQLGLSGLSLNQLVFEPYGYNFAALNELLMILSGKVGALMLDMYWNEFTQTWQLCPAPFPNNLTGNLTNTVDVSWNGKTYQCEPGLSPADVMATITQYFRTSNVKVTANMVLLLLNLKSIYYEPVATATNRTYNSTSTRLDSIPSGYESPDPSYLLVGNSTLAQSVSGLGSWLFMPLELQVFSESSPSGNYTNYYSSEYPTQYDFLFNLFKRTMVSVVNNDLRLSNKGYNISSLDKDTIFVPTEDDFEPTFVNSSDIGILTNCSRLRHSAFDPSLFSVIVGQSRFRTVVDSLSTPFTNDSLQMWTECGFNTVLNASYKSYESQIGDRTNNTADQLGAIFNNFVPLQYWSWAPNQPNIAKENTTSATNDDDSDTEDNQFESTTNAQFAFKCIAMTSQGWTMSNCYDKYRLACQRMDNPFDWTILSSLSTYFDSSDNKCPENYAFGLPQLSIEQGALWTFLDSRNILAPVWIDLNDITVTGCYVTGGPYAECPYTKIVTTLNLIRQIAPSVVVAFVIILLVFWEKFFLRTPVHSNRKHYWKRAINQYYKENEYEGVPS